MDDINLFPPPAAYTSSYSVSLIDWRNISRSSWSSPTRVIGVVPGYVSWTDFSFGLELVNTSGISWIPSISGVQVGRTVYIVKGEVFLMWTSYNVGLGRLPSTPNTHSMVSIFNIFFRLDNLGMNGWWHPWAVAVIECSNDHGQDEGFGVALLLSPLYVPKTTEWLKSSHRNVE